MISKMSISDWFSDQSVFITGGTGFMGKILISKLLLSCPDIGDIFILVRRKKGVDPHTRWHLILQVLQQAKFYPFSVIRCNWLIVNPPKGHMILMLNRDFSKNKRNESLLLPRVS